MHVATGTPEPLPHGGIVSAEQANALVTKIVTAGDDVEFSTKQILQQCPELREFRSCVLDLAYEEYCRRCENGQAGSASEFANGFGSLGQSLLHVIRFDRFLHDHPSMVDEIPESSWPKPGECYLGKFDLVESLGSGALSRVFLARQAELGSRLVVVKVCLRGEREADLLGKLEHPGIAPIHGIDRDEETGLSAICMPFLTRTTLYDLSCMAELASARLEVPESYDAEEGKRLQEKIAWRCPDLPPGDLRCSHLRKILQTDNSRSDTPRNQHADAVAGRKPVASSTGILPDSAPFSTVLLHWGAALADALAFAHGRNVLHCDVKPGNILVMPDLSVSLLDFNLASQQDDEHAGPIGGTIPFMASEQLMRLTSAPVDWPDCTPATDVFGLCASLWFMATGYPPFGVLPKETPQIAAAKILLERQRNGVGDEQILAARRRLPESVIELLLSGLSLDPQKRPEISTELAAGFRRLLPKKRFHWSWPAFAAVTVCLSTLAVAGQLALNQIPGHALSNAPASYSSSRELAATMMAEGQFAQAEPILQDLAAGAPSDSAIAAMLSRCRIGLADFAGAEQAVAPFVDAGGNDDCRFLRLYAETCQVHEFFAAPRQGMATRLPQQSLHSEQETRDVAATWDQLVQRWSSPSAEDRFRDYRLLNLAWIQFQMSKTQECRETLQQLQVPRDSGDGFRKSLNRLRDNLLIEDCIREGNVPSADQLNSLQSRVAEQGVRGEVLLLVHALLVQADRTDQNGTDEQRDLLVNQYLEVLEAHIGIDIDPIEAQIVGESESLSRTGKSRELATLMKRSLRPIPTRLDRILVLPQAL
ncbi:MAG: protein kinase [Planctomycetaceae bacterium]